MRAVSAGQAAELIRVLALAWKNLAAYPRGHPALVGSVEAAHDRLVHLRGPSTEVAFGIAADGIIYGDEKIDSAYSQKLAQALYTRGVAVLRFSADTTPQDLEAFLRLIGGSPDDQSPIWEHLTAAGVISIHLQPVDYSAVQVTDDLAAKPKQESGSLWDDILRALLAGRELSSDPRQSLLRDVGSVDQLAAMIVKYVEHPNVVLESQFDPDATFGIRLTPRSADKRDPASEMTARVADAIGRHITAATGLRRQLAVQQIVQLLRSLPEPLRGAVLRSVVRALATDEQAGPLLREVTESLPPGDILDALQYVATMSKLSTHAVLLLQSLVQVTAPPPEEAVSSPAVIAELVQLFGEEDIDRFNPPDHRELLTQVSIYIPQLPSPEAGAISKLGERVATVADDVVNRLLARTLFDLLTGCGAEKDPRPLFARLESLFRSYLANGQFAEAVDLIERCQELALTTGNAVLRTSAEESLQRLADHETIEALVASLLAALPEQIATIQRLIQSMGSAATRTLLMRLAEEKNRSRRRRLFDFVTSLGTQVVPDVRSFLGDSRWYVVRNMILVLRAANDRSSLPDIRRLAQHPDLRVRLEAIKSLLVLDPSVPRTLLENAINDRDPKLAETAVALVGNYGIREAVDPLLRILDRTDVFGARRPLRIRIFKALGELAEPAALPRLQRFFQDTFLPWPNIQERRAAYESLAGYPADARARFVERGLRSRDPEIRAICEKLQAE